MNEYLKTIFDYKVSQLPKIGDITQPKSGVYFLWDKSEIVYIGQSKDIDSRVNKHKESKEFTSYSFIIINDEKDRRVIERGLINAYLPYYNNDSLTQKIRQELELFKTTFQKY